MPRKSQRQAQAAAFGLHQSQGQLLLDTKECDTITSMDIEAGEQEDDSMTDQMDFKDKLNLPSIGDVFQFCKRECGSRKISVYVYMTQRHFGLTWRDIDALLHNMGGNQCKIAHK